MDTKSHLIFGEEICRYFDWSEDYASWAVAPDIDTAFLHRYWRHRFAAIKELYKEYPKVNHGVPIENKKAIGTLLLSHFYLDIFNAPIFCWGVWLPANHIPPEMTDDLLRLIIITQSERFYTESRNHFRNILLKYTSAKEFCGALLNTLRLATVWLPQFKFSSAVKQFTEFTGLKNLIISGDERNNSYYRFLKYYFRDTP